MPYLSIEELQQLKFKSIGVDVKISNKASIYNPEAIEIDDNSRIDDFCVISGKVKIGKNVHIAPFCLIAGGDEGIHFDDFSGCAYGVKIFSQSDDYSGNTLTNPTVPKKYKKEIKKKVHIGRHVIIGTSSLVFPGVHIKDGCAIGALTLVNKDTDEWCIYVGNPARKVKQRNKNLLSLESEFLREKD